MSDFDTEQHILLPEQNKFSDNFNYKSKISDKTKRDSWFYYADNTDDYSYGDNRWK